jgi:hypothetical protein
MQLMDFSLVAAMDIPLRLFLHMQSMWAHNPTFFPSLSTWVGIMLWSSEQSFVMCPHRPGVVVRVVLDCFADAPAAGVVTKVRALALKHSNPLVRAAAKAVQDAETTSAVAKKKDKEAPRPSSAAGAAGAAGAAVPRPSSGPVTAAKGMLLMCLHCRVKPVVSAGGKSSELREYCSQVCQQQAAAQHDSKDEVVAVQAPAKPKKTVAAGPPRRYGADDSFDEDSEDDDRHFARPAHAKHGDRPASSGQAKLPDKQGGSKAAKAKAKGH